MTPARAIRVPNPNEDTPVPDTLPNPSARATATPKTRELTPVPAEPSETPAPDTALPEPIHRALALETPSPDGHPPHESHPLNAVGGSTSAADPTSTRSETTTLPSDPLLDTIRTIGRTLDDLEYLRIMNGNRIGALERAHGDSLPELDLIQKSLRAVEHEAHLALCRSWRKHPLAPWQRSVQGAGEKTVARLIAEVGDPAARANPAKLWAYCGHGNPDRRKAKGMSQDELFKLGNPIAKKRLWLISVGFVKCMDSPYRAVYDARRAATAERTHARPCVRCGPAGHPAPIGSAWSDGHKHADAIRVIGKAFLKDLWRAARDTHRRRDAHSADGVAGEPAGEQS